jgi:hypothetical protein
MPTDSEQSKPSGWLRRLNYTPPSDLFRGRLTGRLDFERQFEDELGRPLAKHVGRIISVIFLYTGEQIQAAEELAEQCRRELADGTSVEQLIKRLAIKPTRKAIRKQYVSRRGWWGRNLSIIYARVAQVFLVLFACCTFYFYNSHPTLKVDYLALLNESATSVPEDDRAWPEYRKFILEVELDKEEQSEIIRYGMSPTHPRWSEVVVLIDEHQSAFPRIREAAAKPGFGLTVGYTGHYRGDDARALWVDQVEDSTEVFGSASREMNREGLFLSIMSPHLGQLRNITRLLAADAYLSLERDDPDRFCADMAAIAGTADHAAEIPFLICGRVGLSSRNMAYGVIGDVLIDDPGFLDRDHLKYLAEILGKDSDGRLIRIEGERYSGLYFVQRVYTDNGQGGGHLTPDLLRVLDDSVEPEWICREGFVQRALISMYLPMGSWQFPGRSEFTDWIELYYARSQLDLAAPKWQQVELPGLDELEGLDRYSGPIQGMVYAFLPNSGSARFTIDCSDGRRVALLTGIALERYRRDHGDWPISLEVLKPAYLSELPIDPITGGQAIYKVVDGLPLIYSVGVDRDDDGGRIPINSYTGKLDSQHAAKWYQNSDRPIDGDWVLYPARPTLRESGASVVLPEDREPIYEYGSDGYGGGAYFSDSYGDPKEADSPAP